MVEYGVAGALLVLFGFYRKDVASWTKLWKNQSDAIMEVVKGNTSAITESNLLHRQVAQVQQDILTELRSAHLVRLELAEKLNGGGGAHIG
jgi:hypothetical protein